MNRCSLFIVCVAASLTGCTTAMFRVDAGADGGSDVAVDAVAPDVSFADREDVSAPDQIDVVMDDRADVVADEAVDVTVVSDGASDASDAGADGADSLADAAADVPGDGPCAPPYNNALNCGACGRRCVGDATCQSDGSAFRCVATTCAGHSAQLMAQGELPSSTDQTVRLDPDGLATDTPFNVTCVGLDTMTPKEYVSVRSTDLSQYGASPAGACGDFRMSRGWTRLRLLITPGPSPQYAIDPSDRTFVNPPTYYENNVLVSGVRFETCTGISGSNTNPNLAALGVARVCGDSVEGFSGVDLSLTPFRVPRSFVESYRSDFMPTGGVPAPDARIDIYEDGSKFVPVVEGYCAELWPAGWDRGVTPSALASRRIQVVRSEREPLLAQSCSSAVQLRQRTLTDTPVDLRFVMSGVDTDSPTSTTCPVTNPAAVRWARVVAAPGQTLRISMRVVGAAATMRVLSDCSAAPMCLFGARAAFAQTTVHNSDAVNPRTYVIAIGLASGSSLNGVRIGAEQL